MRFDYDIVLGVCSNFRCLQTIITGCKVWVTRPIPSGTPETRKAEVLSRRDKAQSIYIKAPDNPADKIEFYIHYVRLSHSHRITAAY